GQEQEKLANYLAGTDLPEMVLARTGKGAFGFLTPEAVTQVVGRSETIVYREPYFYDVQGCDSAKIAKNIKIECPLVVTGQCDFKLENGKTIQAAIVKPLDWKAVLKAYKALTSAEEKNKLPSNGIINP